jgi:hypothetical protein
MRIYRRADPPEDEKVDENGKRPGGTGRVTRAGFCHSTAVPLGVTREGFAVPGDRREGVDK